MKRLLLLCAASVMLVGCVKTTTQSSIEEENLNPLTAIQYGDELANTLANLIIQEDPILQEDVMEERIQKEITAAKAISRWGKEQRAKGKYGSLITFGNEEVGGQILFLGNRLYLSPTFFTDPGPSLHLYHTTAVDPRDGEFPDETALDIGEIQSAYGAQTYLLTLKEESEKHRTAVLWDTKLNKLYSFAQLNSR